MDLDTRAPVPAPGYARNRPSRRTRRATSVSIIILAVVFTTWLVWFGSPASQCKDPEAAGAGAASSTSSSIYRLNAGGGTVADSIGRTTAADGRVTGGATHAIAGTAGHALSQSERRAEAGYDVPKANGDHTRPPTITPSGQAMPTGDLPGWHQVFSDDFATDVALGSFPAAVSRRWTAYSGVADTSGYGRYSPSKVISINNGVLTMNLHTEGGTHRVSAPLPVIPGHRSAYQGQTYGRYAVRFRADPVPGYKTAWLLWPDDNNWDKGEIDFPEGDLDSTVGAFMHHCGDPQAQDAYPTTATYDSSWHTAVIEWTPAHVTFTLDGTVIGNDTDTAVIPNTPMHWVLQTETTPSGPTDTAAGDVQIDWVTIYSQV